jgi:hypothetical protein
MFIINFCLNMFRASLCPSSGEQRPCVTAFGELRWFCWMWLVAVVGRRVVGCQQCSHPTTQTEVDNKHLIVASCLFFSLSSHIKISWFPLPVPEKDTQLKPWTALRREKSLSFRGVRNTDPRSSSTSNSYGTKRAIPGLEYTPSIHRKLALNRTGDVGISFKKN